MQSIVQMAQSRDDMEVVARFMNRADSAGLSWAAEAGIATELIEHKQFCERLALTKR